MNVIEPADNTSLIEASEGIFRFLSLSLPLSPAPSLAPSFPDRRYIDRHEISIACDLYLRLGKREREKEGGHVNLVVHVVTS